MNNPKVPVRDTCYSDQLKGRMVINISDTVVDTGGGAVGICNVGLNILDVKAGKFRTSFNTPLNGDPAAGGANISQPAGNSECVIFFHALLNEVATLCTSFVDTRGGDFASFNTPFNDSTGQIEYLKTRQAEGKRFQDLVNNIESFHNAFDDQQGSQSI